MLHQTKSCTYPDSMKEQISTAYWHEKLKQLGIIVIIPSYNNGKTLADVIESVRFYAPDILVVNDGSTDETAEILHALPQQMAGVEIETECFSVIEFFNSLTVE